MSSCSRVDRCNVCRPSSSAVRMHKARRISTKTKAVPNIRFEFEPDRIVGQMDYSYSAEYCHDLEPEYG